MKPKNKGDINLIWEAYLNEEMQPKKEELTDSEKKRLKDHYKSDKSDESEDDKSGSHSKRAFKAGEKFGKSGAPMFVKSEASHDNRSKEELEAEKEDLKKQDQKHFRVPKDHKKKKIDDAQKPVKEEGLTPSAIDRIDTESPEFSQETWMLMKGDPRDNTVKVIKKYTGLDSEGAVQQLATMLADIASEDTGLPRDEHFPYEDKEQRGFDYFVNEIPEGTTLKRIIEIDEDFDLICVAPDDGYMMDELGG
jgi:hypothetical protein